MKTRIKLTILVTTALLLAAIAIPRIIEARRANAADNSQPAANPAQGRKQEIASGVSIRNDTSIPLREMKQKPADGGPEREANHNPKIPHFHKDSPDRVVQQSADVIDFTGANMPATVQNFDGIPFPGVCCNCAPPDTNGEVGATQYVQIVNKGFQVFDKNTGHRCLDHQTSQRCGAVSAASVKRGQRRPGRAVRPTGRPLGHLSVCRRFASD